MIFRRLFLLYVVMPLSVQVYGQTNELLHTVTWTEQQDTLLDPSGAISIRSPVNKTALVSSDSMAIAEEYIFNYRVRFEYDQAQEANRFDAQVQEFSISTFAFEQWLFNAGKTQISWDMGSSFQPLGFFQPTQNLFDLNDQQSLFGGLPLVAATYLNDGWSTSFVYSNDYWSSDDGFNSGVEQWASRIQWMSDSFDWSLVIQKPSGQNSGIGTSVITSFNEHTVSYFSAFYRQGTRQPQNMLLQANMPVFADFYPFQTNLKQANVPFWRGVVGTSLSTSIGDFTFEFTFDERNLDEQKWSQLTSLIELHGNTVVNDTDPSLQQLAAMNLFYDSQSLRSTGAQQRYAFVNFQRPFLDGSVSLFTRISMQDKSGFYGFSYTKELNRKLNLFSSIQIYMGEDKDEFGLIPINSSIQLTLRYFM